mmetsp:Transcript_18740/g.43789  ORF Transcript_18740/g.43789 Transcript_18740/m.43789 type:complete len:371 (-) Transcript_18740:212-1324(-)
MGACVSKGVKRDDAIDPKKKLSTSKSLDGDLRPGERGFRPEMIYGSIFDMFPHSKGRCSVVGAPSDALQKGFSDKNIEKVGDLPEKPSDLRIGYACKKGHKPESPNQDDFCVYCTDELGIFGVFDGHGPYGHDVSSFVHGCLPHSFVLDSNFKDNPEQALRAAFPKTLQLCQEAANDGRFDCDLSGTTATLAMYRDESLYTAHVGDCRLVLARDNRETTSTKLKADDLTQDHKPDQLGEKRRIESYGGQIRRMEGDLPCRVFLAGKMYPGLTITRSIGDAVGARAGVTSSPEIARHKVQRDWKFLLMCSDGVWEFMTSQEAVDLVAKFPASEVQKASEALAAEAWNRWIQEEGNIADDITVVCIWLPTVA